MKRLFFWLGVVACLGACVAATVRRAWRELDGELAEEAWDGRDE